MALGHPAGRGARRRGRAARWALALALPAAAAAGAPASDFWRVETREWRRSAGSLDRVRLTNRWGDVRARAGEGDEVYLKLVGQRHRDDPREPTVAVEESEAGLEIEVRFAADAEVEEPPAWAGRRIDLALYLPERLSAAIETDAGLVELRGLRGDASIRTRSGDVRVRAPGHVTATSEHGELFVHFLRTDWRAPVELVTVSGAIRVQLPAGGGLRAEIETRGEITTDYSIDIEKIPGHRLKRARAVIGEGGQLLRLRSGRGAIRLLESAVPEADPP